MSEAAQKERVFYAVGNVDNPKPEPFCVLAIYPDRPKDGGVEAVVISLHMEKCDADKTQKIYWRKAHEN